MLNRAKTNDKRFNSVDFNEGIQYAVQAINMLVLSEADLYFKSYQSTKRKELFIRGSALEEVRQKIRGLFEDRE